MRENIPALESVNDWASVEKLFKSGNQGLTGILKTRKSPQKYLVFKISQEMNYLIEHEYKVMKRLNDLSLFCPHFCKVDDFAMCKVEPRLKKHKNPFEITGKHSIFKATLFEEYIKGKKLGTMIDDGVSSSVVFSGIKQVLMAIAVAQYKSKFTHYDLHSDNVIMSKCDQNTVFLYVFDKTAFAVPSGGYKSNIIDFGFSHIDASDDADLTVSTSFTDIGYLPLFDWITDPKVFLISSAHQLTTTTSSPKIAKFNNCVKNMFMNLNVDWENGWDDYDGSSIADELLNDIDGNCKDWSFLFAKQRITTLEILQSIIVLPFKQSSSDDLVLAYSIFTEEFAKIEECIGNTTQLIYILKTLVDFAKIIKSEYENSESRTEAVDKFKNCLLSIVDSVAKFCNIKKINYERMLCALYLFGECASGYIYKKLTKRIKEKTSRYNLLPVKSMFDIINVIYYNTEDPYVYNKATKIVVFDIAKEKKFEFNLTGAEIRLLVATKFWFRSHLLLEMYLKRKVEKEKFIDQCNSEKDLFD